MKSVYNYCIFELDSTYVSYMCIFAILALGQKPEKKKGSEIKRLRKTTVSRSPVTILFYSILTWPSNFLNSPWRIHNPSFNDHRPVVYRIRSKRLIPHAITSVIEETWRCMHRSRFIRPESSFSRLLSRVPSRCFSGGEWYIGHEELEDGW